jgi:hypothetical protein
MLVQFTPLYTMPQTTRARLNAALQRGLAFTAESSKGYVMFEGMYIKLSDLPKQYSSKQTLMENV